MSNTSDIEEGEIPDQESLAIPTSSKNSKPIPKRKPDRPYDSDSSASSEQVSSDDSDNEWWDRKKVKGEKGSQDSDNEDSDGDVIEITDANPNYFKKGNWKSKRDFNRDDINARKGFHKKKMGPMQDKAGFKRTFQAAKANRRAFPPGSPPKVAMYPCKFYIVFGKCDDPNCKNVHAPLTRDDEMLRFISENEEFFADIAKRRQELNLSGFLLKILTDKYGPPQQPQIGNAPPNFGMNRPLPPPKAQMQPAPFLPPNQGPPPMGNFNNYPPGSNFPNMPARPPGMPHQGPPPSYMPPQNGPQPMMHNMPPQDPRFGQNPNMPPRNPGFEYPPQPQQNFAFAPAYRPPNPNPNPNPNPMFGGQFQQEPKLNFGQEQINYPPQNNQGYDYNKGHNQGPNQGLNQGPPIHAQQQHGNFNPYQPQYPQQQHQQHQPQQPPVNMNQMNRAPGQEESQPGFMNQGAGNMGPPNVGVQGQGTFMMPTNNYQVEPRFQDQTSFSNVGNFPAQVQQNIQQNPLPTVNNGYQESQGAVKGSSPTEPKGAGDNGEGEPKRAAMNDIEKFNEKMKNFGILNFGGSGTASGNVEKEDTKADEELQRQIKEAIREETKGADGAGLSGNISINDQILKQIKSVLPQFQSQSPDNIKNLVNIYLKLSKDPRLQNKIQS